MKNEKIYKYLGFSQSLRNIPAFLIAHALSHPQTLQKKNEISRFIQQPGPGLPDRKSLPSRSRANCGKTAFY
jgi:hypothetical protein